MELIGEHRCFGGRQLRFSHSSSTLNCTMQFSVFLPEHAGRSLVPALYWLSGLTCTDENFVQKAGAQRYAAEYGIAIVCPDTSPRGEGVPDDVEGGWDFGLGAGFYVDATRAPWSSHYRMYSYVVDELPMLLQGELPLDPSRRSISGHSMGGHGALVIGLRNPASYRSISAFAPIVAPTQCPWGQKALSHYLGESRADWAQYDSCALLGSVGRQLPILVDQGDTDEFLAQQLQTPLLAKAATEAGYPVQIRMQPGYDHSYFFIASFIADHLSFHASHLC